MDRTFVAIRTLLYWEWHESCFILGEKCGLGMVAFILFACACDFHPLFASLLDASAFAEQKTRWTFDLLVALTSHCSLVKSAYVLVSVRPSMIEGAGDSAETPPPTASNIMLEAAGTTHSVLPSSTTFPPTTGLFLGKVQAREGGIHWIINGVRATERRMLQLRGCYSGRPYPSWIWGWFA